ncbi:MAG: nuclear transport factor 2 family protein [Candidatus Pedobacter colombiensis]|uniref:Nuclear transport factor 2 family protein n=1 Tax=Candidatus Pedobacter colombiensis TaxID=3121371 RepID=A0AAJ5W8I5_9SPHI|nr:nuclear transport factor 2 family protein [Pedobacter sp.]WEK19153.1 MAG: nuclear transport factor 2 family protein [Pedobacter sp.]
MSTQEELIHHFYTSFQRKDVQAMQDCYADNASFSDPVFTNLNTLEVRSMWAMLLKNGKDMRLEFKNISTDETGTHAEWDAWYTFSATGNRVHNHICASFIIENGKIIKHTDHFSFYKWAKQALGFTGLLLGWTSFIKNKIRAKARKNLEAFMARGAN